ncbi:MAG: response regulator [Bacteroidetes bacterium]|nr:response regulator [Bacteroidota bacterium]
MIKIICIDDEKDALEVLQIQLHQHFEHEVQVLGLYSDSREGIAAILELKPDLVFLDIEMPFKNGFEVLEETKEIHFKVIFTTAYNQFAIKAFKVSAVDYLLKPIDGLELVAAVKKVIVGNQEKMQNQIAALLNQFSAKTGTR